MLILNRRVGERLILGDNILITILDCRGHQVRVGVDAPAEMAVHREEVYLRIKAEREDAVREHIRAHEGLASQDLYRIRGFGFGELPSVKPGEVWSLEKRLNMDDLEGRN